MIAWETHSGEDVERAIATYVCLEHPTAVRIRPSQGDGGIDVIRPLDDGGVAVYQIKRFAANLTAGQKRQIRDSWEAVLEYASDEGVDLREWFLVMPLDPTKENLKWFEGLTAGKGVTTRWLGRSHVDGWAAKMPYVGDHYFRGDRDSLMATARTLLLATQPNITNEEGLLQQIESIRSVLGALNPHYSFDFKIIDAPEKDSPLPPAFSSPPGTVMSEIRGLGDGRAIQIDIIAKHAAATDLSPIGGRVTLYTEDERQRGEVQDFLDYGTPIRNLPASIVETGVPSFISHSDFKKGSIWIGERPTGRHISVSLANGAGDTMDIVQESFNQGQKGVAWRGAARDKSISILMKANAIDNVVTINITYDLRFLESSTLSNARRRLGFFRNGERSGFTINVEGTEVASFSMESINMNKEQIRTLYEVAKLLLIVDAESASAISFPREISESELSELRLTADIIQKGTVERPWSSVQFEDINAEVTNEVRHVSFVLPLTLHLMGRQYACGYMRQDFIGVWDKERRSFLPVEDLGNVMKTTYIGPINDTGLMENRVYCSLVDMESSRNE